MTLEEYLQQPLKYDRNGNPVPIKDVWSWLTREDKAKIKQMLKKGIVPEITKYL